jgi:hypothetical protein
MWIVVFWAVAPYSKVSLVNFETSLWQLVPGKHWYSCTRLHCVMSKNSSLSIMRVTTNIKNSLAMNPIPLRHLTVLYVLGLQAVLSEICGDRCRDCDGRGGILTSGMLLFAVGMNLPTFQRNFSTLVGCSNAYNLVSSGKLAMTECKFNCTTFVPRRGLKMRPRT